MMKWFSCLTKCLRKIIRKHLPSATAPCHDPQTPIQSNEAVMEKKGYFPLLALPAEIRVLIYKYIFENFILCV